MRALRREALAKSRQQHLEARSHRRVLHMQSEDAVLQVRDGHSALQVVWQLQIKLALQAYQMAGVLLQPRE